MADLARKDKRVLRKKYQIYFWCAGGAVLGGGVSGSLSGCCQLTSALPLPRNIATIAVFYALPVVQLVITYQTVSGQGPC